LGHSVLPRWDRRLARCRPVSTTAIWRRENSPRARDRLSSWRDPPATATIAQSGPGPPIPSHIAQSVPLVSPLVRWDPNRGPLQQEALGTAPRHLITPRYSPISTPNSQHAARHSSGRPRGNDGWEAVSLALSCMTRSDEEYAPRRRPNEIANRTSARRPSATGSSDEAP
jgi:hypothetical protein